MKIAIFGSYGQGNIGDEAILSAVISNIKEVYNEFEIDVYTHDVSETQKYHKDLGINIRPMIPSGIRSFIKQYKNGDLKISYEKLKDTNLVVIGGGGIFYDAELDVGINPIFIWLLRTLFFRIIGLKIVVYAVGIGPIKKASSYFMLKLIGNLVHGISVRDSYSRKLFEKSGSFLPVIKSADPVWTLEWEARTMESIREGAILEYGARKKIGIQVRRTKGVSESELVKKLSEFSDHMIEKYLYSVVLMPFSKRNPKDSTLMEKIQTNSRNQNHIEIYEPNDLKEASQIFQECEFLLLTRLHSIIIATQLGIPFIALSYSPKTDSLIDLIGMNSFAWPIQEIEVSILDRIYLNLMKKRVTIKHSLIETSKAMKEESLKNMDLLLKARK